MKKIRRLHLSADALRVESFDTGDAGGRGGTVHGHGTNTLTVLANCACPTNVNLDCTMYPTCAWAPYPCVPETRPGLD